MKVLLGDCLGVILRYTHDSGGDRLWSRPKHPKNTNPKFKSDILTPAVPESLNPKLRHLRLQFFLGPTKPSSRSRATEGASRTWKERHKVGFPNPTPSAILN